MQLVYVNNVHSCEDAIIKKSTQWKLLTITMWLSNSLGCAGKDISFKLVIDYMNSTKAIFLFQIVV